MDIIKIQIMVMVVMEGLDIIMVIIMGIMELVTDLNIVNRVLKYNQKHLDKVMLFLCLMKN